MSKRYPTADGTTSYSEAWVAKAHSVIAAYAREAFERANRLPDGRLRKKHQPYTIPEIAERLVDCLGRNDEAGAKAIFLYELPGRSVAADVAYGS